MAQSLAPINGPVSLEKFAYDAIKEAILVFKLKPGESLVENDLARQLGISKTPVRDALLRLEKEGFVTKIPYKGYYVMEITRQSVEDMFEIRSVLEGLAARLAVKHFSPADLDKARSLIRDQEQALSNGQIEAASDLNRAFHNLIIQRANNERLEQMLGNLDDHLQRYRILSNAQSGRLEKSAEEHQRVLEAIQGQNSEEAEVAVRAHILSVLGDLENQDFQELVALASSRAG